MRQVGIVVRDIEKAMRHWVEVCGVVVPRAGVSETQIGASLAVIHGFRDVNDGSKVIDLLRA